MDFENLVVAAQNEEGLPELVNAGSERFKGAELEARLLEGADPTAELKAILAEKGLAGARIGADRPEGAAMLDDQLDRLAERPGRVARRSRPCPACPAGAPRRARRARRRRQRRARRWTGSCAGSRGRIPSSRAM